MIIGRIFRISEDLLLPGKLTGRAALGQLVFFGAFCSLRLCSFVLAPLSASVASFGQLFEKVQWNIPPASFFKVV